jgi:hypothetical protein
MPPELRSLFWDCDFSSLELEKSRAFVTRRVLDRGDWDAISWLRCTVGDAAVREWFLAKCGGGLDPPKLRFWGLILDLPKREVDDWVKEARKTHWQGEHSG